MIFSRKKIKLWIVGLLFLNVIAYYLFVSESMNRHNLGIFYFKPEKGAALRVNNEPLSPPFWSNLRTFEPIWLSTFLPNKISYGKQYHTFNLNEITPDDYILVFIGLKKYRIKLYNPQTIPTYHVQKKNINTKGYYFFTPNISRNCSKSAALIVNEQGKLVYYRRNKMINRCVSDFKKVVLPNNKVRYTLMEQEKAMPPYHYWGGSLLVMDERFKPIKRLKLLPFQGHPALPIENHHSIYLDDNHYILSSYYNTEMLDNEGYPVKVTAAILQEIKDNKVIFEFNSAEYPEHLNSTFKYFSPANHSYKDYWHYNNLQIDPKDGNWILSFAQQSAVMKLNKETKKIEWILGGYNSSFPLKDEQYFFFQHTPTLTKDGALMIFDNGTARNINTYVNADTTQHSRIIKFYLSEKDKTVKDFKEIKLPFHAYSMGSVYETDDGSYIISGGSNTTWAILEITPESNTLFHIRLQGTENYRSYKYKTLD